MDHINLNNFCDTSTLFMHVIYNFSFRTLLFGSHWYTVHFNSPVNSLLLFVCVVQTHCCRVNSTAYVGLRTYVVLPLYFLILAMRKRLSCGGCRSS